jgi:hypothetical protein
MSEWALVFAVLVVPMAVLALAALGMRALGLLERIANALEYIAKSLTHEGAPLRATGDVPADVRESVAYAFRALAEELER